MTGGLSLTGGGLTVTDAGIPGGGTVTSVNASGGGTGLTISGGPVTSVGTLTLAGTLVVASGGTGTTTSTGSGSVVLSTSPSLTTARAVPTTDSSGIFPLFPGETPPTPSRALSLGSSATDGWAANPPTLVFNDQAAVVHNASVTPLGHNRSVNVNPLRTDFGTDFAHGPAGDTPSENADSTAFRWQGFTGNRSTTLAAAITTTGQTSITVTINTNTGFWPPAGGGQNTWSNDLALKIGDKDSNELIVPTSYDNATGILTGCVRGARGTTAQTWANGSPVEIYRQYTYASLQFWNHINTIGAAEGSLRFFVPNTVWSGGSDQRAKVLELNAKSYVDLDGSIVGLGLSVPNGSAVSVHTGSNTNLPLMFGSSTTQVDTITASIAGNGDGTGTLTVTANASAAVAVGTSVQWTGSNKTRVIALGTGTGGNGTYTVSEDSTVGSQSMSVFGTTFTGPGIYANNQDLRISTNNGTDLWGFKQSQAHYTPGSLNVMNATATPAGGTQDAGILFGTTAHFGIIYGSGIPTVNMAIGSVVLNSDGVPYNSYGSSKYAPLAPNGVTSVTSANYTVLQSDTTLLCNRAGQITLTLPAVASFTKRRLRAYTITANAVISNASNVVPQAGGSAGTAILAATAGKWADLECDGTSWNITASN